MGFQNNFTTFFCRLGRDSRRFCIATRNSAPVVAQSSLQNSNAPIQIHPAFISTSRKVLDSNSDTISRGSTSSPPLTFGTVEEDTLPDHHWSPTTAAMWKQRIGRNFSGPAQQVLLTKHPDDSRTEVVYDYATNAGLREKYRNPWGYVRLGRILEDLDSLAGTVAAKVRYFPSLRTTWPRVSGGGIRFRAVLCDANSSLRCHCFSSPYLSHKLCATRRSNQGRT